MGNTPSICIDIWRDVCGKRTQSTNLNQLNFHQARKYLGIKHWDRISLRLILFLFLLINTPIWICLGNMHWLLKRKLQEYRL